MRTHLKTSVAATVLLALAATAHADDKNDDVDIVKTSSKKVSTFGATKSDIPILETARSVEIVTEDMFIERGALNIANTLDYSSGVVGSPFGFSTRGDFIKVRNANAEVYLDNIQLVFGRFNNIRSELYALEQVEVLKGPASVLYGQAAPGGIVNTISKKANKDYLDKELVLSAGSFARREIATDLGFTLTDDDRVTARLVGLYRDADTQIDYIQDDSFFVAPSVTYQDDETKLTALFNYSKREGGTSNQFIPVSATGCATDQFQGSALVNNLFCSKNLDEVDSSTFVGQPGFDRFDSQSTSLTVFAEHDLTDNVKFEGTARLRDNEAIYNQSWISFGTSRLETNGDAVGRTWQKSDAGSNQFAFDARLRSNFTLGVMEHEVLTGLNFQKISTDNVGSAIVGRATGFNIYDLNYEADSIPSDSEFSAISNIFDRQTETEFTGFYVNDQIEIGDFVINGGIRFDTVETVATAAEDFDNDGVTLETSKDRADEDAVSLSFGALYRSPIGLNPYISYAESFLPVAGIDLVTQKSLRPREGEQIEVGLKYNPSTKPYYVTAAYFEIEQSNLNNTNVASNLIPTQFEGNAKYKGFEIEAHTKIHTVALDINLSNIKATSPLKNPALGNDLQIDSIPEALASAWGVWRPERQSLEGFEVGAGIRHAGENETNGVLLGFLPASTVTDGYTVFDGLIGYSRDNYDFSINVRNLADKEYYATCLGRGDCFTAERRTIVARLAHKF